MQYLNTQQLTINIKTWIKSITLYSLISLLWNLNKWNQIQWMFIFRNVVANTFCWFINIWFIFNYYSLLLLYLYRDSETITDWILYVFCFLTIPKVFHLALFFWRHTRMCSNWYSTTNTLTPKIDILLQIYVHIIKYKKNIFKIQQMKK